MDATLYVNPISPFARKAMILNRVGTLNIEEIAPTADPARGYASDINPLGKIPALRLADGAIIVDSPIICEWLDARGPKLLGRAADPFGARSLHAIGDGLASAVYDYRYETVRPSDLHWETIIKRKSTAIRTTLAWLDKNVDRLVTGKLSWAGLAIGCALDYCDYRYDAERPITPALDAWHANTCTSDVWRQTHAYKDA